MNSGSTSLTGEDVKTLGSYLLGSVLVLALAGPAQAAECGIGSKIWAGNSSTGAKIMASITNYWTLKGISTTFEILGCTAKDNWFKKGADAVTQFTSESFDHIAEDMSRGRGEHLDALAEVIAIDEAHRAEFRGMTRSHFEELFPSDEVTVGEMLEVLANLMATRPSLSVYVEG
jgi:hypothetical protein